MSTPPVIQKVIIKARKLHVVLGTGETKALYRYVPLQDKVNRNETVTTTANLRQYIPLPALTPAQLPDAIEAGFASQVRLIETVDGTLGDLTYDWDQATYNGWPLYYYSGTEPHGGKSPDPDLFDQVSSDLNKLVTSGPGIAPLSDCPRLGP